MSMNVLTTRVYVHHISVLHLWSSEEGTGCSGPGVLDGSDPLCKCNAMN